MFFFPSVIFNVSLWPPRLIEPPAPPTLRQIEQTQIYSVQGQREIMNTTRDNYAYQPDREQECSTLRWTWRRRNGNSLWVQCLPYVRIGCESFRLNTARYLWHLVSLNVVPSEFKITAPSQRIHKIHLLQHPAVRRTATLVDCKLFHCRLSAFFCYSRSSRKKPVLGNVSMQSEISRHVDIILGNFFFCPCTLAFFSSSPKSFMCGLVILSWDPTSWM